MNIFLSGAHGVGKTTLVKKFKKDGWLTKPSVSRQSPYEMGTVLHQHWVMNKVYKNSMTLDNYAFDRTPIDVASYTEFYLPDNVSELMYASMKVEAFRRSNPTIFYIPIEFELESDGVRPDLEAQSAVDKYIKNWLDDLDFDYVTVTGSISQRVELIKETIDGYVRVSQ